MARSQIPTPQPQNQWVKVAGMFEDDPDLSPTPRQQEDNPEFLIILSAFSLNR